MGEALQLAFQVRNGRAPACIVISVYFLTNNQIAIAEEHRLGGGLNYYRNLDINWRLQASLDGKAMDIPALCIVGDRDAALSIPGMTDGRGHLTRI
jgi:hypothetical protein